MHVSPSISLSINRSYLAQQSPPPPLVILFLLLATLVSSSFFLGYSHFQVSYFPFKFFLTCLVSYILSAVSECCAWSAYHVLSYSLFLICIGFGVVDPTRRATTVLHAQPLSCTPTPGLRFYSCLNPPSPWQLLFPGLFREWVFVAPSFPRVPLHCAFCLFFPFLSALPFLSKGFRTFFRLRPVSPAVLFPYSLAGGLLVVASLFAVGFLVAFRLSPLSVSALRFFCVPPGTWFADLIPLYPYGLRFI